MADPKEKLQALFAKAKNEAELVVNTIKDKGAERFARPLIVGLIAALAGHQVLYKPSQKKLARLTGTVKAAEATSKYAEEYVSVRDAVLAAHSRLPGPKEKDTWLFERVREALNAEGLITGDLTPPQTTENAGLAQQRMNITVELRFPQLVTFLARIEGIKPPIMITQFDMSRSQSRGPGYNRVSLELTSIIPLRRPG